MWVRRRWILFIAVTLLVLGISLIIVRERGDDAVPEVRPEVGHLAPDFTLVNLEGETVRLSGFRGKQAVFLNFWATWCGPCRLEMPTMETVYRDYKNSGLEILAVSLDAGPHSGVTNFMQELNLSFPVLLDPDMEVLRLYRMFSIPASFLIDKQGIIRFKELGYRDWTDPESRKLLEAILP